MSRINVVKTKYLLSYFCRTQSLVTSRGVVSSKSVSKMRDLPTSNVFHISKDGVERMETGLEHLH